jgi:hypothetical protein
MAQGPGEVEDGTGGEADTTAAASAGAATTDDIRSQIEHTRAEMSGTIDAIQTRLSPARALADVTGSVTDATVGRLTRLSERMPQAGRNLLERARRNPLPVALLATAVVGLMVRALNHGSRRPATRRRSLNDAGERDRHKRIKSVAAHRSRRLVTAASAGAACWAVWYAQTLASRSDNAYSEAATEPAEGL